MDFLRHTHLVLAYLDPGSGSFIIQIIVATLLGGAIAVKAFWGQITRVFRRGAPPPDDASGEPPADHA